jgi:hypothetical protein
MRIRPILILSMLLAATSLSFFLLFLDPAQSNGWEQVAPGIEYREYQLPDPNNVYVARLDRSNPDVSIESGIAQGKLYSGRESVSGMASRYDESINYVGQTWGNRSQVAVAINGDFFNVSTGVPFGGQIISGWYAKRFQDLGGGSGFVLPLDQSRAFIGECVNHNPAKQIITFPSNQTLTFDGINVERKDYQVIIYTPQFDANTHTENIGVDVVVELTRPFLIIPPGSGANVEGTVRQIRVDQGNTQIPFDSLVISSRRADAVALLGALQVGDVVKFNQEITHYESDCVTPLSDTWLKAYTSIGGSFYFLKDSSVITPTDPGAHIRNPRTAVAFNDSYIYFIVIDGRDPLHSIGMNINQVAIFARDTLSATYGISQDGGGSSTMVINGEVKNNVFCNNRCFYTFMPLVNNIGSAAAPPGPVPLQPTPGIHAPPANQNPYQRWVANSLMMVVVGAKELSGDLTPGQVIDTFQPAFLRLGPGTNYAALANIAQGDTVSVLHYGNTLNGILAKGSYWWKVSWSGMQGWLPQEALVAPPTDTPPPPTVTLTGTMTPENTSTPTSTSAPPTQTPTPTTTQTSNLEGMPPRR